MDMMLSSGLGNVHQQRVLSEQLGDNQRLENDNSIQNSVVTEGGEVKNSERVVEFGDAVKVEMSSTSLTTYSAEDLHRAEKVSTTGVISEYNSPKQISKAGEDIADERSGTLSGVSANEQPVKDMESSANQQQSVLSGALNHYYNFQSNVGQHINTYA